MKKMSRILSAALVAVMVLSLSAVAMAADETTVFIPTKLPSLIGDISLADYKYPTLSVKMSSTVAKGNPCPILAGEDADYLFTFSEKPDWAGAVVSELDGGWINIDVDDDGNGIIEGPLVRQPGMWSYSGPCVINEETGACEPLWYGNGGNYPYYAGKDYGDYSVEVAYHRNGTPYRVTVTLKDSEDFFRTGNEGGVMKITFERIQVKAHNNAKDRDYKITMFYVAQVSATYAEGPKVIGVETDWRNDKKETLASYRISYAMSDGIYKITYAPTTTTIYEGTNEVLKTYSKVCKFKASENVGAGSYHHYTADEALMGLYFKTRQDWEDDNAYAVSGSGWKVAQWFKWNGRDVVDPGYGYENSDVIYRNNNGGQIKNIKHSTQSGQFKSPRVLR